MVMLDLEGKIQYANTAYCEMSGYAAAKLLNRNFVSLDIPTNRLMRARSFPACCAATGKSASGRAPLSQGRLHAMGERQRLAAAR